MFRILITSAVFATAVVAWAGPASAVPLPSCTTFTGINGTLSLPGTYVGSVGEGAGNVCQIGDISSNGVSGTGTFVNNSHPTSIYSFAWAGGVLSASERLGNNGLGKAVDVYLDSLSSLLAATPASTIASIAIPFSSGPSASYALIGNTYLAAGYYDVRTVLSLNAEDPTFQVNFAVPEPATMALLLGPLAVVPALRRRRTAGA